MASKPGVEFHFSPIGYIQTPFKDKFGIPRQPGLVVAASGVIKLGNNPDLITALKTLEEFSHIWIIFVFHEHGGKSWKPSIRPPRLGGQRKVGVLSSRSPHRPNPIGISAVPLVKVDLAAPGGPEIHVSGVDLLDGTPILDIKPYLPFADSIPQAHAGWASEPISRFEVRFSKEAEISLGSLNLAESESLRQLIIELLELDPRPAFKKRQAPVSDPQHWGSRYGFEVQGRDVKYELQEGYFLVVDII